MKIRNERKEVTHLTSAERQIQEMLAAYDRQHGRVPRNNPVRRRGVQARSEASWNLPESRSVRVSPRWKPQTSFWKALRVAESSLVVLQGEKEQPVQRTKEQWHVRIGAYKY